MAGSAAAGPQDIGDVIVTDDATMKRAVAAAAIGNVTEWYDFGVYSYLVESSVQEVFFSGAGSNASLFALGTFAVSFLVRPIGGLFFGPLGDRIGRTKVLSITVILMAAGTFLLGLVPSYAAIGIASPLLVLVIRLIQGFSTGGEYGGAMTFIAEYSADKKRGFFGSWLEFGTLTGYALGASISTALVFFLPREDLLSWGFRIPFLLALPLGLVGLYLRNKLEETPAFKELLDKSESSEGTPTGEAFKLIFTKHWRAMLVAGGLIVAWNVTNYVLTAYVPTYTTGTLRDAGLESVSSTTSNLLQIGVLLILMVVITFLGRISDRIGRKPLLITGSIMLVVLGLPSVLLLQSGLFGQMGGLLIMGLTLVMFSSICPSTLPSLFPTEIRYGGLSITFNLFVSAFAGTAATVIAALVTLTGDLNWPGYYLIAAGVVGLVSCYFLVESAGRPLEGSKPAVATEEEARELVAAGQR
ncbi:MHS family proline/betaine transporter-like MFS transporter [Pseudonocardia sediminis]|uniref:Putative proline/betaine transporter n=1 Tax=Pseudonocardia sediminis TaxID=1397368 RepID=A0A4Q7UQB7_PSEST|nr:MHS family proline/betaine transporter-like MFS transporter [Pseudonocardia sediminis]